MHDSELREALKNPVDDEVIEDLIASVDVELWCSDCHQVRVLADDARCGGCALDHRADVDSRRSW